MVVPPTKRIPDLLVANSEPARADLNPYVSARATGDFIIGYDDAVSATNVDAKIVGADETGAFQSFSFAASSTTSNETRLGIDGLASGDTALVWLMHDGLRVGGDVLGNLTGYTAIGTGDFNQDGTTDILWQNNASGAAEIWFMGAGHMIGSQSLGNLGGYSLLGVGDFNGDHTSDPSVAQQHERRD